MKKFSALLVFITLLSLFKPSAAFAAASLTLSPASSTKSVNDTFSVDIVLDTGGDPVGGATAILTYDTTKLQVQGSTLTPGPIFGSSVAPFTNTVDTITGQIRYDSGTLGTPYTGRGTLATMTFRAIAAGTAQVNFVFNPSSTTGTSIVAAASGPTNLLTNVGNGIYTVTSGVVVSQSLPPSGAVENTLMVLAGGVGFLAIGLFLSRKALLNT